MEGGAFQVKRTLATEQAPACLLQRWDLGARTSEGNLSAARGRDEALYMDRLYGLKAGNHSHV